MSTTNFTKVQQNFSGLGISPHLIDKDRTLNGQNRASATNVDEEVKVKDDTIRHLNQHATMLEAQVHQLEGIKEQLETALKEREQELARAEEHILKLRQFVKQRAQHNDMAAFENAGDEVALYQEVHSLRKENNSLKKRAEGLASEADSLRQSMSAAEQGQNSDGGSLPLMSLQVSMELESLHQVVDTLKSTVIQQRSQLLKLRAPQTPASLPAKPRAPTKARPADAGPANFQHLPPLHQGEEKEAASPCSDPFGVTGANSPKRSSALRTSSLAVHGTTMTGGSSNQNVEEAVKRLAGESSHYNSQHQHWPLGPATSGVGDRGADVGKGLVGAAAASTATTTPKGVRDPVHSGSNNCDNALSDSSRGHAATDRLCPVCNREFGSLSFDQFQSHVLECFDTESGPETMVAKDLTPHSVCPVCNTNFGDEMSQSEFEKHVNSHFDEDFPD